MERVPPPLQDLCKNMRNHHLHSPYKRGPWEKQRVQFPPSYHCQSQSQGKGGGV